MKDFIIKEFNEGTISITEDVIKIIAEQETVQVVGVGVKHKQNWLYKMFENMKRKTQIKIDENGTLIIDIPIKVVYGTNIRIIAEQVQEKIILSIENMLGLKDVLVNVTVEGLIINEED